MTRMRRSDDALSLPANSPGRMRTFLRVARIFRKGDRLEILRWDDPHPFVRETRAWFRALRAK